MFSRRTLLPVLILCIAIAGYIYLKNGVKAATVITVASKDFTENILVSEIYAQILEAEGYTVKRKQALGGTPIIHAAMLANEVNLYPEYTSTALVTVLKQDLESSPVIAYNKAKKGYEQDFDFIMLNMTAVNNAQGMAITKKAAERYGIRTLTDLSREAFHLRLCATPEFEEREDGLAGLRARLGGFEFKDIKVFSKGLKYEVLREGKADVNICFTTDANLAQGDIVPIVDDILFWPPYNLVPVARKELVAKNPKIVQLINAVSDLLDTDVMQRLNAEVDLKHREYKEVAAEFLKEKGFVVTN